MRTFSLLAILAVVLLPLPGRNLAYAASDGIPVQYNPRLNAISGADLDRRLRAPFAEGVAHPKSILNCAQWLASRNRATRSLESESGARRSALADCVMLQELHKAVPAHSSYLHDLAWDERVLPLLPPQLAIAISAESKSAAETAASQGHTWRDFDPTATASPGSKGPEEIVVSGNGFSERLVLWGRGDFTGDGLEDLLVQSFDTLTEGSYRNTRLFVLTRRSANGPLTLISSPL
jgi:hypothetical protein